MIVAAHPDDETIGATSLLLRIPGTAVVFLTDGAPRDPRLRAGPRGTSREAWARLRREEAHAALAVAGLGREDAVFLGGIALPHPAEMTSYHLYEGDFAVGEFLPGSPAVTVTLDAGERAAKRRMLEAYASQREVLAPFGVDVERFRRGPRLSLDDRPHRGALNYERMAWTTWETFRAEAIAGLARLGVRETEDLTAVLAPAAGGR